MRRTPSIMPPGRKITTSMNSSAERQLPALADEQLGDGDHDVLQRIGQEAEEARAGSAR